VQQRAFTVKALVLSVLAIRDGLGVTEIQHEILQMTGGVELGHSAVYSAGKSLAEDGLVVASKEPRASGGGPKAMVFRLTKLGRETAEAMREQAERLLYWPKLRAELERQGGAE